MEVCLVLTCDLAGCIVILAILLGLDRLYYEFSVAHENIIRGCRVFLKFFVCPAGLMRFVIPLFLVHLLTVELIAPEKLVALKLRCLRLLAGTGC